MAMTFDLAPIFKQMKEIFFLILRQPFELWYIVPNYIKLIIIGCIVLLTIFVLILVLKNKRTWMHKSY